MPAPYELFTLVCWFSEPISNYLHIAYLQGLLALSKYGRTFVGGARIAEMRQWNWMALITVCEDVFSHCSLRGCCCSEQDR